MPGLMFAFRLVSLLSQEDCSDELVREGIISLGSFAHGKPQHTVGIKALDDFYMYVHCVASGTSQNVHAVLNSKALPLLIRGTCVYP